MNVVAMEGITVRAVDGGVSVDSSRIKECYIKNRQEASFDS